MGSIEEIYEFTGHHFNDHLGIQIGLINLNLNFRFARNSKLCFLAL